MIAIVSLYSALVIEHCRFSLAQRFSPNGKSSTVLLRAINNFPHRPSIIYQSRTHEPRREPTAMSRTHKMLGGKAIQAHFRIAKTNESFQRFFVDCSFRPCTFCFYLSWMLFGLSECGRQQTLTMQLPEYIRCSLIGCSCQSLDFALGTDEPCKHDKIHLHTKHPSTDTHTQSRTPRQAKDVQIRKIDCLAVF